MCVGQLVSFVTTDLCSALLMSDGVPGIHKDVAYFIFGLLRLLFRNQMMEMLATTDYLKMDYELTPVFVQSR